MVVTKERVMLIATKYWNGQLDRKVRDEFHCKSD